MAMVRCPLCGRPNPADVDSCRYCGTRLKAEPKRGDSSRSPQQAGHQPSQKNEDWLDSLRDSQNGATGQSEKRVFIPGPLAQEPAEPSKPEDSKSAPDEEFAAWLSRIGTDDTSQPADEKAPGEPAGTGDSEDWLSSLREVPTGNEPEKNEPGPGEPADQSGADSSDWLNRIEPGGEDRPSEAVHDHETPEDASLSDEELPAWLKELSQAAKPENASNPPTLPEQSEKPGEESAPQSGTDGREVQQPDWFSGIEKKQGEVESKAEWEVQFPDWLSAGEEPSASEKAEEIPPESAAFHEPGGVERPSSLEAGLEAGGAEKPEEEVAWSADLPDWLSGITSSETPAQGDQAEEKSIQTTAQPEPEKPEEELAKGQIPGWMTDLKPQEAPESETPQTPALIYDESPITGEQAEIRPFVTDEMPDWLVHLGPPEVISSAPAQPEPVSKNQPQPVKKSEEEAGLAPAELPGWVQAMRPIETATPAVKETPTSDERVENTGPLAGVRGIIPPEPALAGFRKPAVYSVKLVVSEKQRTNAALLQTLLAVETEPQKVTRERPSHTHRALRIMIALILIVAVGLPIGMGGTVTPLLTYPGPPTSMMAQSINTLPAGSTVLVAVEYDPGLSGEVETVSAGVLAQLMARSANIVFVSTNPAGPILAHNLLNRAIALQPTYSPTNKVASLGYLAGGPAALFNLSLGVQTSMDLLKSGGTGDWSTPPLNGIKTLADFSRVLVLTDNADTARNWVEQVKPSMGSTPLLMVVSAQSAPMISPYLDSGQITGMVTGLAGGVTFEQAVGRSGGMLAFWDSYQFGLVVMIALILIGGVAGIWMAIRSSRHPRGEA